MAGIATPTDRAARDIEPMSPGRAVVAMTRPSQVVLIWLIYAAGVLLGLTREGAAFDLWAVALVAVLVTGAAVAAHLVNEAEDAATDRLSERTPFSGGSGALEASDLDPSVPRRLGLGLAVSVVALSWAAWWIVPLPAAVATLVTAGLLGAVAYSLPPVAAMRRGWGEPLNAVVGGLLLPLTGVAVAAGAVGTLDVLAFVPFTLVVLASVMATAWVDREPDAAAGKRTMQVRLRPVVLRRIHAAATIGFMATAALAAWLGASPFVLSWFLVLPALAVGLATYTRRRTPLPNVVAMVGLATILLGTNGVGLATGWSA